MALEGLKRQYLMVPSLIGSGPGDQFKTLPEYLKTLKKWRK